jgi:transposase
MHYVTQPADRVKILVYDGTGLVLYSKRLEAGRFSWPSPADGVVRLHLRPDGTRVPRGS